MPSHLAAGPSGGTLTSTATAPGVALAAVGVPAQSRRARRAAQAVPASPSVLPAVSSATVLLPESWELLEADGGLDDAPLVSPRASVLPRQRAASDHVPPLAHRAAPRVAADVPQPMTRRARREIEQLEAALALPYLDPLPTRSAPPMLPSLAAQVARAAELHQAAALAEAQRAATRRVEPEPADVQLVEGLPAAFRPAEPQPAELLQTDVQQTGVQPAVPHAAADGGPEAAFEPSRGRRSHRHPVRATFGLPQAGMVGVLGLATLVAPLVGQPHPATADSGASGATTEISVVPSSPLDVLAPDAGALLASSAITSPLADQALAAVTGPDVAELLAKRDAADQASRAIGERTLAQQAEAQRAAERAAARDALAPGCDGVVSQAVLDAANGRLDPAGLCPLWESGDMLRADAALALAELDLAYREHFGEDIALTDSYRSYASQVAVKRSKPGLAARPGTSQHGWGLAVDLGGGIQKGDRHYEWLAENADDYGWENPAWARRGGSGPYEPWHWEFADGRDGASTGSEDSPA